MRFSLYQRDGYRCLKCGISQEYANLEIDHIVPIAKGGKSTYNNLQTLCHRCNVAKGDSIANYLNHH
ncbi:MAG: HNH endonuclease [Clostridia bacterium]|nr:HNH endonuclease [Clostridia bacterium]